MRFHLHCVWLDGEMEGGRERVGGRDQILCLVGGMRGRERRRGGRANPLGPTILDPSNYGG